MIINLYIHSVLQIYVHRAFVNFSNVILTINTSRPNSLVTKMQTTVLMHVLDWKCLKFFLISLKSFLMDQMTMNQHWIEEDQR